MISRDDRNAVVKAIAAYCHEETTAFEFDDQLSEIESKTEDETVKYVIRELWYCYDDFTDHMVHASKDTWDYFERLRLVLSTDANIHQTKCWGIRQAFALMSLLAFIATALHLGWGLCLLSITIPLGCISISLASWRPASRRLALTPFASFGQLRHVVRQVPWFQKGTYPMHLAERRIRKPVMEIFLTIYTYIVWLTFSPAILFVQSLPERRSECVLNQVRTG